MVNLEQIFEGEEKQQNVNKGLKEVVDYRESKVRVCEREIADLEQYTWHKSTSIYSTDSQNWVESS